MPKLSSTITDALLAMLGIAAIAYLLATCSARAHEHKPGESAEQARVIQFYRTWLRPRGDFSVIHRQASCCYASGSGQDCFPVLAQRRNAAGEIEVMPDVEGTSIIAQANYGSRWYKLNHHINEDEQPDPRESPDGRSHVCVAPSGDAICYVAGWGQ